LILSPQHQRIWAIAAPMMLSNLSVPLLGIVDTAVMGHLDHAYYIGAVAIGALIFSFVYWGFGFLRMGTTGLVAQAMGAGNHGEANAILMRAGIVALVLSILLLLLQPLIAWLSFSIIDTSTEVESHARLYFDIRIWSAPATLITYVIVGWFLGRQNAKVPLLITVLVNVVNIILDLVFVVGLELTIEGVAWASVIADYSGLVLALFLTWQVLKKDKVSVSQKQLFDRAALAKLFTINHTIFVRTLCLVFAFAFFTAKGAEFGDTTLAINALLLNFQTLMAYVLDSFAHAAEALVGHDIGNNNPSSLNHTVHGIMLWALLFASLFSIVYWLAGSHLIALMSNIEHVRQGAENYLPWLIALPLISIWSFVYDGVFIGATRTKVMRNMMIVSTFIVFVPACYAFQSLGNHGLWLALSLFLVSRGITLGVIWHRYMKNGSLFQHQA